MGPELIQAIILIFLLAGSAFFSASETALMSLSKIRVRNMVNEDLPGALQLEEILSDPNKLLSAILVGNNLVNIAASSIATSLAIDLFGSKGVGIATGVMTLLVLIFGEVTPKSFATSKSEAISLRIAGPLNILQKILTPVIAILGFITGGIIKLLGGDPDETQPYVTEEDLRTMVAVSQEEGVLEHEERKIIDNVFEFRESQVKDVMTTRTDMVMVDSEIDYQSLIDIFKEEQFSRLPVYEKTSDNIIGIIYVKDLVFNEIDPEGFRVADFTREAFFTYEYQRISKLFEQLRSIRTAIAIVLDEYGGTAGLATIEDLVEEIVGDLEDEYDAINQNLKVISSSEFICDGSTRLDELNEKLHLNLDESEYDTIGGYIFGAFGRIPKAGEEIEIEGRHYKVLALEKNRIAQVKVNIRPAK